MSGQTQTSTCLDTAVYFEILQHHLALPGCQLHFQLTHSPNALLIRRKHSAASALPHLGKQICTPELPQIIAQKLACMYPIKPYTVSQNQRLFDQQVDFPVQGRQGSAQTPPSFRQEIFMPTSISPVAKGDARFLPQPDKHSLSLCTLVNYQTDIISLEQASFPSCPARQKAERLGTHQAKTKITVLLSRTGTRCAGCTTAKQKEG